MNVAYESRNLLKKFRMLVHIGCLLRLFFFFIKDLEKEGLKLDLEHL